MTGEPFNYSGKLAFLRRVCCDPRLRRTDVAVMSALIDYANPTTGRAFPSISTIVAESGVPKTTTLRALRRLEDANWLTVNKRNGASSTYTLTGSDTGTGSDAGTGAIWNQTGAIQNLRVGKTGSDTGTEAVPTPEPEQKKAKATGLEQAKPDASRPADPLWGSGLQMLIQAGMQERQARAFIGKLAKQVGDIQAAALLTKAVEEGVVDPVAWLAKSAQGAARTRTSGALPRDHRSDAELADANDAALRRLGVPA